MHGVHAVARACVHSFLSAADFSLTSRERLHTTSQFQRVFDQAARASSEAFVLLSRENTLGYPRLGMVVAKRNARRAVDRNMVKRMVRESFRTCKAGLPASDYVVILRRPAGAAQRDTLRRQLTRLWQRCTKS